MPHPVSTWLVRHHPAWWRRRYQDEMLALLDQDPPGARATADLAWSCVRAWGACHLSAPSPHRSLFVRWLLAVRFAVQVPLAVAVLLVILASVLLVLMTVGMWTVDLPGALPLPLWLVIGPIGMSGVVALAAGLTPRWTRRPVLMSLATLAAAVLAVAVPFIVAVGSDATGRALLMAEGFRSEVFRFNLSLVLVYALAVGLIVREVFRGLPLRRCVVNCVHEGPARTEGATS